MTTAVITHLELSTIAALVRYVAKIIVVAENVQDPECINSYILFVLAAVRFISNFSWKEFQITT